MKNRKEKELDFQYSCPVIDNEIVSVTDSIWEAVMLVMDVDGTIDSDKIYDAISGQIAAPFEEVRQTNIKMRAAANARIEELVEERDELKDKVKDLEGEVGRLEMRISDLEWELRRA